MDKFKYKIVTPLAEKDVKSYIDSLPMKSMYLNSSKFVVIGNDNVCNLLKSIDSYHIECINENKLISYIQVKKIISNVSNGNELCIKRTGWYLQQFLKFSYSLICDDDYYLLWDADTIPIHKHDMFREDNLIFDMKTEYHKPYFDTFDRLFPKYNKKNKLSYISEHMIIKTSVMRSLIGEISALKIKGNSWVEKIINAIELKELPYSGFSDYETYGLFCLNKYPLLYLERRWDSLRPASKIFCAEKIRARDYEWLLKDYDAVSFEAGVKLNRIVNLLCTMSLVQKYFSCKKLLKALHIFTI